MKQHNTSLKDFTSHRSGLITLTSMILAMAMVSCVPDQRNPGGVVDNRRSNANAVEFGGESASSSDQQQQNQQQQRQQQQNQQNDPNATNQDAQNAAQLDGSIRFTQRKEELWYIACKYAVKGDIGIMMKDSETGQDVPSTEPINPSGGLDSDGDGISDDCERFLALSPNFGATNPQLYNGYVVGAVTLSPEVLQDIAIKAATVKGGGKIKNAKAWKNAADAWTKQKTDKGVVRKVLKRSENTRLWLGRAMCALSQSGRLKQGDKVNASDSGGIVKTIYRQHMNYKDGDTYPLRMEMEPSRTFGKKIFNQAGEPSKEPLAIVEGGLQNTLIHNVFHDQNDFQLTGPVDVYTGEDEDRDILYVAEAMLATDRSMDLNLVLANELGQPTQGDVKSAFLATLDGDTIISSLDMTGTFDFLSEKPELLGGLPRDCKFDQERLQTTISNTRGQRKHFMLASFYLGKESRDTFFRENLMVQYLQGKEYVSSQDENEDDYQDRFKEYENGVSIEQAKTVYEFLPQNIASILDNNPNHAHRVLMPFMPTKDNLHHLASEAELSGEQYWANYGQAGKTWPELLSPAARPTGQGPVSFPNLKFASTLKTLENPYAIPNARSDERFAEQEYYLRGEPIDPEEHYVDPEEIQYQREQQGDV